MFILKWVFFKLKRYLKCMEKNVTNPISSNQVVDVGVKKPRCAKFNGNSLNDWIKWLADEQCCIDWKSFDMTCLTDYTGDCADCEQDQKKVIKNLNAAVCKLITALTTVVVADPPLETINVTNPNLLNSWATYTDSHVYVFKQTNRVSMQGLVNLGDSGSTCYILPVGYRPTNDLQFLGLYSGGTPWLALINVLASGLVQISVPGMTGYPIDIGDYVSLDSISFIVP